MIIISKIYTKIGETINLLELGNSIKLASWWQKPNILYYCHANWVDVMVMLLPMIIVNIMN